MVWMHHVSCDLSATPRSPMPVNRFLRTSAPKHFKEVLGRGRLDVLSLEPRLVTNVLPFEF
ncbi:hypothetical protein RRG08_001978 [Elysia crispata]|uniref:Uncharacterized protein n=1 Tax=Elysia crispata TaxID=231223 RepID=A0AAE1BCC3_9GAST|nr:hypothetical protein RRG08_001978 [Elysia crispata]